MSNNAALVSKLGDLASEFRATSTEGRHRLVHDYNATLVALLEAGWDDFLDPEAELPDEFMDPRYLTRDLGYPKPPRHLLATLLERCDPVLMTINEASGQNVIGTIERIYSSKFSGPDGYTQSINFVGSAGSWGNVTLKQGERALVFMCYAKPRFYQCHWQGHFSIQCIEGVPHAIANWGLLSGAKWEPAELYAAAFLPNQSSPLRVAIPFQLLEKHLDIALA